MNLDELTIHWFCVIDNGVEVCLGECRFRQRGPTPKMADNEVSLIEMMSGVLQDTAI